jgi:hypothetical protein
MSGHPNPEQVRELKEALREVASARESIAQLNGEIEKKTQLREEWADSLNRSKDKIHDLMQQMDVASPGNHGWEARNFEMLLMLSED